MSRDQEKFTATATESAVMARSESTATAVKAAYDDEPKGVPVYGLEMNDAERKIVSSFVNEVYWPVC